MLRDRIDPALLPGLDGFLALAGPRGLMAVADAQERRAAFGALMDAAQAEPDESVVTEDHLAPGPEGAPAIRVRRYRPAGTTGPLPGVYYIHGGAMVLGSIETEDAAARALCRAVGCVVLSVDYRLAPEHPHPAPVEDCYAGLAWAAAHAQELEIDPARLAVYGGSAGGGLAAATALLARDRGGPALAYQMLVYPMLDDRADSPSNQEIDDIGVFDGWANAAGWDALLGERRGTDAVDYSAAPARCADLAGLPPAWLDVGELDALRDEGVAYALALLRAGVPTDLHVYPAAYHGWEIFAPDADVSQRVLADRSAALRRALS